MARTAARNQQISDSKSLIVIGVIACCGPSAGRRAGVLIIQQATALVGGDRPRAAQQCSSLTVSGAADEAGVRDEPDATGQDAPDSSSLNQKEWVGTPGVGSASAALQTGGADEVSSKST